MAKVNNASSINELYRGSYFWNGVGVDIDNLWTLDEILEKSGANFTVDTTRALGEVETTETIFEDVEETYDREPEEDGSVYQATRVVQVSKEVPVTKRILSRNKRMVYRTDNLNELGIVGNSQTMVQNREVGLIGEDLRNMGHGAWVAAVVGGWGETVYFIQKLEQNFAVKNTEDIVEFYHIFMNGHDGSLKFSMAFVPVHVKSKSVVAIDCDVTNVYEMKHTPRIAERITEASRLLTQSQAYFTSWMAEADRLADHGLTSDQVDEVINYLFPAAPKRQGKADTARSAVSNIFETSYQDIPLLRNTAWHLYTSIAEYADQYKTFKDSANAETGEGNSRLQNRFETIMFRDTIKAKAYKKICKMI